MFPERRIHPQYTFSGDMDMALTRGLTSTQHTAAPVAKVMNSCVKLVEETTPLTSVWLSQWGRWVWTLSITVSGGVQVQRDNAEGSKFRKIEFIYGKNSRNISQIT